MSRKLYKTDREVLAKIEDSRKETAVVQWGRHGSKRWGRRVRNSVNKLVDMGLIEVVEQDTGRYDTCGNAHHSWYTDCVIKKVD